MEFDACAHIYLIYTLENNPTKGKILGTIGGIVIKEIK